MPRSACYAVDSDMPPPGNHAGNLTAVIGGSDITTTLYSQELILVGFDLIKESSSTLGSGEDRARIAKGWAA